MASIKLAGDTSIYWIRLPEHTDVRSEGYIGVTNNPVSRFNDHKSCRAKTHLSHAIKKYGWDNLIKEVILVADKLYCFMMEEKLRPTEHIGWNILKGGNVVPDNTGRASWNKGKKLTDKQKANLFNIAEYMKLRTHGMLGKKHTQESIKKMKKSKTGIIISEDAKQKMSKANKGRVFEKLLCQKCNQMVGKNVYKSYHGDKCKGYRPFKARTTVDGKRIFLGHFATKKLADIAVKQYKENISV